MNLRFHPAIRTLRELVLDGRLGRVLFAQVSAGYDLRRWRPAVDYRKSYSARSELGGGILLDAVHELDYVTWMLGDVASAVAEVDRVSELEIDVEDIAAALLRMRGGSLVSVDLNYLDVAYRRRCLLVGDRATASWEWQRATIEINDADGEREELGVAADVDQTYIDEAHQFLAVLRGDEEPSTSVAEGVEAVRIVSAIRRAAETGSRVSL
jgi:predicted dehydrogenase